jgi:lysophospholipase L1-like esterase
MATAARAADSYVALGDSYSSGLGAGRYGSDSCRRSALAYPAVVVRERPGTRLSFAACAGARTTDVLTRQLTALTPDTAIVTVTAGGNDAGFSEVLRECAKPAWISDCAGRLRTAQAFVRGMLPARLDVLYARIRALAPRAIAVALGYPRLFAGRDCDLLTWFSPDDQAGMNTTADLLAATIRERARARGLIFVDAIPAFAGHAVCDREPWLNGLSSPLAESYHPNALGQRTGLAALVLAAIG